MNVNGVTISTEDYGKRFYRNPQCISYAEYLEDVDRIKYIKRLLRRYHTKKVLRENLIIRHLIILNNVFPCQVFCEMLFADLEPCLHVYLKTFLESLHLMPKHLDSIGITRSDILEMGYDQAIAERINTI